MAYQNSIDKRIAELEKKSRSAKSHNLPICFVNPGEDCEAVEAHFRMVCEIPGSERVVVVEFMAPG